MQSLATRIAEFLKGRKAAPIGTIRTHGKNGRKRIKTAKGWEDYKEHLHAHMASHEDANAAVHKHLAQIRESRNPPPHAVTRVQAEIKRAPMSDLSRASAMASLEAATPTRLIEEPEVRGPAVEVLPAEREAVVGMFREVADGGGHPVMIGDLYASAQIRKAFDRDALKELADSIEENGLIQPIVARESRERPGKYEIIAGERRYRALKMLEERGTLKPENVNVVVKDVSDREKNILQLEENYNRVNNTPGELADFLKKLQDDGLSTADLAKHTGKSESTIKNYLAITNLDQDIRKELERGGISTTAAQVIGSIDKKDLQVRVFAEMLRKNMSTATLRTYVAGMKEQGTFFTLEQVQTETMKRAREELGDKDPNRLQSKFQTIIDKHQATLNKFLDQDGARLSSLALAATGDYETSMNRLQLMQGELDRVMRLMKEHHAKLSGQEDQVALFKSALVDIAGLRLEVHQELLRGFVKGRSIQSQLGGQSIEAKPTEAQKEAGNYAKGHVRLHGLDITIENARGSTRSGKAPDGTEWESRLAHHYGYVKGTEGADGDHVDVFIGPDESSTAVFIVNQIDPGTGLFDEHKVMLGFKDEPSARAGYLANYEDGWSGLGSMVATNIERFREWLNGDDTTEPFEKAGETAMKSHERLQEFTKRGPGGEGSRGGHIIGHTPSGNPVYASSGRSPGAGGHKPGPDAEAREKDIRARQAKLHAEFEEEAKKRNRARAGIADPNKRKAAYDIKHAGAGDIVRIRGRQGGGGGQLGRIVHRDGDTFHVLLPSGSKHTFHPHEIEIAKASTDDLVAGLEAFIKARRGQQKAGAKYYHKDHAAAPKASESRKMHTVEYYKDGAKATYRTPFLTGDRVVTRELGVAGRVTGMIMDSAGRSPQQARIATDLGELVVPLQGLASASEHLPMGEPEPNPEHPFTDGVPAGLPTDTLKKHTDENGMIHSDRRQLYEAIKAAMMNGTREQSAPRAIMMMGGPASGNSTMVRASGDSLDDFVVADADAAKAFLPEYRAAVQANFRGAAAMVHEESSYLVKEVRAESIATNRNLVIDGTGSKIDSYESSLKKLRARGYTVKLYLADCDVGLAKQRARDRATRTGRFVPDHVIEGSYAEIPANFVHFRHKVDAFSVYDTSRQPPVEVWSKMDGIETIHDAQWYAEFTARAGAAMSDIKKSGDPDTKPGFQDIDDALLRGYAAELAREKSRPVRFPGNDGITDIPHELED